MRLSSNVKRLLAATILLVTIATLTAYFIHHPEYFRQLATISPWTVVWVFGLNIIMLALLLCLGATTIGLCGKHLGLKENFLLTSYSSVANFFGPLQSGPGVRAAYLKTRYQVRLRDYALASLLSLGFFAVFSALFLVIGTRPWWQTALVLMIVIVGSILTIRWFRLRDKQPAASQFQLRPELLIRLALIACLQVMTTAGWYFAELRAVDPHISLTQAMSYAGAANFSLFVSITPDAVGIRETFLLFSQHIHHVPTSDIVSANVIDRAVYVVFLGVLFAVVLALHAKQALGLRKTQT